MIFLITFKSIPNFSLSLKVCRVRNYNSTKIVAKNIASLRRGLPYKKYIYCAHLDWPYFLRNCIFSIFPFLVFLTCYFQVECLSMSPVYCSGIRWNIRWSCLVGGGMERRFPPESWPDPPKPSRQRVSLDILLYHNLYL